MCAPANNLALAINRFTELTGRGCLYELVEHQNFLQFAGLH